MFCVVSAIRRAAPFPIQDWGASSQRLREKREAIERMFRGSPLELVENKRRLCLPMTNNLLKLIYPNDYKGVIGINCWSEVEVAENRKDSRESQLKDRNCLSKVELF